MSTARNVAQTRTKLMIEKNGWTMTTKKTASSVLQVCLQSRLQTVLSKVVQRVLQGKQPVVPNVRIAQQVSLARVQQIWNVKCVKLDIIKTNKVFHLVSNVFQDNTKMLKVTIHAQNVNKVDAILLEVYKQEIRRQCAKTVSSIDCFESTQQLLYTFFTHKHISNYF